MLSGGWPLLGHAPALRRDPARLLRDGHARFGDLFSFRLPGTRVTAFLGPRAHAAFFGAPEDQLSAREVYRFTVPIFGRGVVYDATPPVFDEQMGFLFPALRDDRLRTYARVMQEETEAYTDTWGDAGEIDLAVAMNELTVFIATRCLIGDEMRRRVTQEFAHLYHDLERGINLIAFFNPHLPLPAFRRRDRARAQVAALIAGVIAERRERGVEGEDFLQTLMAARYSDGRPLSDDEITGLLLGTIFAGQHTSAIMSVWTGLLLLEHPEHLPAVLAEQREVLPDGRIVDLAALRRLVALERCIKEAERMHPPLVMLMRRVLREIAYGEYIVPAGDLAMVSPAAGHRIAGVFRDPDRYDPDRFGPGRQEDRAVKHALIGFGGGHHRCIGSTFAEQQIKVIWSVLLRRFDLTPVRTGHRPDYSTFVVGPRPPCIVRYRRRLRVTVTAPALTAVPS
ncbi:MAG: cytochrome P450 [Candidatus Rokuibacteriota bacterium]